MKKLLLFAATLCLAATFPCRAHVPGARLYYIFEFRDDELPDLHDGSLDDWKRVFSRPTFTHYDFQSLNVGEGASIGPPDLAVNVYLGWSEMQNRLYAAIERLDDVYVNTYEGGDLYNIWRYDSFEIMVDGDHSGGPYSGFDYDSCGGYKLAVPLEMDYWDPCRYLNNFQAQQYTGIAAAPDGRLLACQEQRANDWVTVPPYGDAGGFVEKVTPHRSVVEMMVTPFDELRWDSPEYSRESALRPGKIIGLQVSIPDFDEEAGKYHGFSTLEGQSNTWRLADNFVDCLLLGPDRNFFEDSDVILEDFRFRDESGDGVLDAGETGRLVFDPRPGLELPTGGVHVRLRSADSRLHLFRYEGFTSSSLPFEPLSFTWEVESEGLGEVELELELEQQGRKGNWPLMVATHSPRLPGPGIEVVDSLPEGYGNGDGIVQSGEIVQLVLALDADDMRVIEGTEVELRDLDARLSLLEKGKIRFGEVDGQVRTTSAMRFLVDSEIESGDRLGFALATRRQYAAWVETLYVQVGEGGDRVPPVFTGEVQIWHGEDGLHLLYPRTDFIEGGEIENVEFALSGTESGRTLVRFPLQKQRGYWEGMLNGVSPGDYEYVLTAADQAGNEAQTLRLPLVLENIMQPGKIRAVVGGGERTGVSIGTYRKVLQPLGLAVDRQGRLYIADAGLHQLLRWDKSGVVEVLAGAMPPRAGYGGDGGPAAEALLNRPSGVAVDGAGQVYIADSGNHRIRRIGLDGTITTIAGSDSGFAGDGGLAVGARFAAPRGLYLDRSGDLYVADSGNRRVRRIDAQGIVSTVAGSGAVEFGGDGGPALLAGLIRPVAVVGDALGELYIADMDDHRIRRVAADGTIATVAGIGDRRSPAGDGDPATEVRVRSPQGLLLDGAGNLLIAEWFRVRRVDRRGIVTTVMSGWDGVYEPAGLAADAQGNLYVGDARVQRVLEMVEGVAPVAPVATAVGEQFLPTEPVLLPSYPNPFNSETVIRFSIPARQPGDGQILVELAVYDVAGQLVRRLMHEELAVGPHRVCWDGRDQQGHSVASGVYLSRLATEEEQWVRKMLLVR